MWAQIKKFLTTDLQVKLGSLVLAVLLWFFVVTDLDYFHDLNLPLIIEGVPLDQALSVEVPTTITARFHGRGNELLWADLTMPVSESGLVLDLSKLKGTEQFHLDAYFAENPDKIRLPRDYQLDLIHVVEPESLWVSLEARSRRDLPVQVSASIVPAVGYMLVGDIRIEPVRIEVEGPLSLLGELGPLRVPALELEDVNADVAVRLPVEVHPAQLFTLDQDYVEVFADIQSIGTVSFTDVAIRLENVPRGVDVTVIPAAVRVEAEGGLDRLLELQAEDFTLYFDFARNWNPEQQLYEVESILPEGVRRISQMFPEKVEVVQQ